MADDSVTITLTAEEFGRLQFMLGYATCAANQEGDRLQAYRFLDLANCVNRTNPRWRALRIPDEFKSQIEP